MLSVAMDMHYFFSPSLRNAILDNQLVNPCRHTWNWYERDLLQEHLNFWLKRVFNGHLTTFNSSFLHKACALNILNFCKVYNSLWSTLGLAPITTGHSKIDIEADINVLGRECLAAGFHRFVPGCTQSYIARDAFTVGGMKLIDRKLQEFIDCMSE